MNGARTRLRSWYLVHKWTSLISTVFLLLLCVTGLPLIFAHEIDHLFGHDVEPPPRPGLEQARAPVARIIADALARGPGSDVQFLVADAEKPELLFVRLGTSPRAADISAFLAYDRRTGEFLHAFDLEGGFMNVMLRLHVDLYAGLPGTLFLGAMGLLLVVALASGIVLYGPFMRRLPFGTIRGRGSLLHWLDLHNLLGITTLAWLGVVGATGVINALSIPIFADWQRTELADMLAATASSGAPLDGYGAPDAALAAATLPGKMLSFMAFPRSDFAGPRHYVAFMQGTTPLTSQLLTPLLLDAEDGRILAQSELPWTVSALLLSQPLHFGDYGGLALKMLWALLDLIAIAVLVSGLVLWFRARRVPFDLWWARQNSNVPGAAQA